MRFLSPKVHGYFDYTAAALYAVAPFLFGFTATPRTLSFALAGSVLVLSLLTAYPLGAIKAIPFPVHGAIEFLAAVGAVAAPWLLGFADEPAARNFFVVSGVGYLLLWLVTNYRAASARSPFRGSPAGVAR